MGINLKVGEDIPLAILLENRATDRFVRATVRDSAGAELVGSPFPVAHVANGFHYDETQVTMPDEPYITVEYDVYDDSGFTTLSTDLLPDHERFDKDDLASAIDQILAAAKEGNIKGSVADADDIKGKISDDDSVTGQLADEDLLSAKVQDEDQLTGKVEEDTPLAGQVEC